MGSGKVIRSAITKHGIENFTKVVLESFENAEAMYARIKLYLPELWKKCLIETSKIRYNN